MAICELIEIRVLNVGDADAIIVVLKKEGNFLVILIDAGRENHFKKIDAELQKILTTTGKTAPDLIICTHYDYDHIGGLGKLMDIYGRKVKEIWMHKTSEIIKLAESIKPDYENSGFLPAETTELLSIEEGTGIVAAEDDELQAVLRNLQHEVAVLKKLQGIIEPKEPIYGQCSLDGWPEIKVLGPTAEYYKELFPAHFDVKAFLDLEKAELKHDAASEENKAIEALERFEPSALTPTNLNSAVILIQTDKGRLLFAGDAGVESFKKIPNYQEEIKDITWLKVPHHGSANNLDKELIELMKPQFAYISGKRHVSPLVVNALREAGAEIMITSEAKTTLVFPIP